MLSQHLASAEPSIPEIPRWTVFEQEFKRTAQSKDPLRDVSLEVVFQSPSRKEKVIAGFWDGGNEWKVRMSPDELGKWTYQVRTVTGDEKNWVRLRGAFQCVPYLGKNELYVRGAVRVAPNKRYLQQDDGTPFFWLSDTAWNGPLKADPKSWATYLEDRQSKGFSVVQFVTTQWIAAESDADGRRAYSTEGVFSIDPKFFERMDARIKEINQFGMIAAPVLIWDVNPGNRSPSLDPGTALSDEEISILVKYQVARFGAYQVAWILAGDGDYRGEKAERWRKIGRAVFGDSADRIVTLHPAGHQWVSTEFEQEPWFSFVSYQSGHGDSTDDFRWITSGPASESWNGSYVHPIINLEPNYEGHLSYQGRKPFDGHAVRRAAYWSLLITPVAGVAYGAHGIWSWQTSPGVPMNHEVTGIAPVWSDALRFPGSTDMKHLKDFFGSLHWWTLRPAPDLLIEQPAAKDAAQFVAAARSESEGWAVLYLPVGQTIRLDRSKLSELTVVRWFNPSNGGWLEKEVPLGEKGELSAPNAQDWIAWVGTASGK